MNTMELSLCVDVCPLYTFLGLSMVLFCTTNEINNGTNGEI